MRALISSWRKTTGNAQLPFCFVQLPGRGARAGWPYLREQQRLCMDVAHAGMVVTFDRLDSDLHPVNKIDVGEQLAAWALANNYAHKVPFSGPAFERAEFTNRQGIVHFTHAANGLMVAIKNGTSEPKPNTETPLSRFELAGAAGQWFAAEAKIIGQTISVQSSAVPQPTAVRFAYAIEPQHCHLYNTGGLPASPSCSDSARSTYKREFPE